MKRTTIALATIALAATSQLWAAETPAAVADRMLDPTRNAAAFKDPQAFAQWLNDMANPATSLALAQKGMDPNTLTRMVAGMMNPAAMQNYMQFTDPAMAMKWMAAGMNPNFYTALMAPALNPATAMNWMTLPMNPQMLGMGMQALNPAMYANWMAAPMSPQAINTMMAPMNPNLYTTWLGAGMNPQTYGAMGQMMAAPLQAAAPATAFDPSALLRMLPVPAPAK